MFLNKKYLTGCVVFTKSYLLSHHEAEYKCLGVWDTLEDVLGLSELTGYSLRGQSVLCRFYILIVCLRRACFVYLFLYCLVLCTCFSKYSYWSLPQPPSTLSLHCPLIAVRSLFTFVQSAFFVALAPLAHVLSIF